MEKFKLTAKEFLLLCTATEADEVYGVDDAYGNINEENIEKELRKVQTTLEEKQYIQSDFDGNSEIRDDLLELINCCVECDHAISIDHSQANRVYYIWDDKVVKSEKKNDIYTLEWTKKESLYSDIKNLINILPPNVDTHIEKFHMPQKELKLAKESLAKKDRQASVERFKKYCDNATAEIMADAIDNNDFYSVTEVDFDDRLDSVQNLMVFVTDKTLIKMTPIIIDLIDEIEFCSTSTAEINELLDSYIERVGVVVDKDGLNG